MEPQGWHSLVTETSGCEPLANNSSNRVNTTIYLSACIVSQCILHQGKVRYASVTVATVIYHTLCPAGPQHDKSHSYLYLRVYLYRGGRRGCYCPRSVSLSEYVPSPSYILNTEGEVRGIA